MLRRLVRLFRRKHKARMPGTLHFSASEFACRDGSKTPGKYAYNLQTLMRQLEVLRWHFNSRPVVVMSGYRSRRHNTLVGGASRSKHLVAQAADIKIPGVSPGDVADAIALLIKQGKMLQGGLGRYSTFTHYDIRGVNARWGSNR